MINYSNQNIANIVGFKVFLFCLLLLTNSFSAFCQDTTFSITFPDNWIQFQRNNVLNSVKNKYDISKDIKEELLAKATSQQLFGYAAPTKSGTLYRPNIQVLLIKSQTQSFSLFKTDIQSSLKSFKTRITDFKVIDSLTEIIIDGKKSLYAKITGFLLSKASDKAQLIFRVYAIPIDKYFYQITMNDSKDYDCKSEFKKVLSSLKL